MMEPKSFIEARRVLGLTQEQMARVMRTSTRQIQRWERGETKATGPTMLAVELLLEICGSEVGEKYGV